MVVDKKANLFIVGAMRAGTTSFIELLRNHPDIYVSPIKEPNFFIETLPKDIFDPQPKKFIENYFKNKFPKPIHRAHIKKHSDYCKLFENVGTEKYLAEASVSYLHAPNVAARIQRYNSDAKIIILTRDPTERVKSHYLMNQGLFRERRNFEEVMNSEIDAYNNGKLLWYSPLGMSFYKKPILNFKDYFKNNVLEINMENLALDTQTTLLNVTSFLEVSTFNPTTLPCLNKNRKLRFNNSFRLLHYIRLKKILFLLLPERGKIWVKTLFLTDRSDTIEISHKLNKRLELIFKKEC